MATIGQMEARNSSGSRLALASVQGSDRAGRSTRNTSTVRISILISVLIVPLCTSSESALLQPSQAPAGATAPSAAQTEDKPGPSERSGETSHPRASLSPWQLLAEGVTSHIVARRQEALAALGTLGTKSRAVQLVVSALDDKDASIRQHAARNLGKMHAKSAIPRLKEALNDDSAGVSFAAAKSLWDMGDHTGRDVFIEILAGERSHSGDVMKDQLESARKRLQDPRGLAVIGAKEAANSLFGPAGWGIKIVEEITKDRSVSARAMSATVLGHDASLDAINGLDDALDDKNWIVRTAAAEALGECKQPDQIKHLTALLSDDKPAVRYMAAASIIRLSSSKAAADSRDTGKSSGPATALQTPERSR
jgi:HEAT repeat protein